MLTTTKIKTSSLAKEAISAARLGQHLDFATRHIPSAKPVGKLVAKVKPLRINLAPAPKKILEKVVEKQGEASDVEMIAIDALYKVGEFREDVRKTAVPKFLKKKQVGRQG